MRYSFSKYQTQCPCFERKMLAIKDSILVVFIDIDEKFGEQV